MQRGRRWQLLQLISLLALAGLVGFGLAAFDSGAGRDEPRTGNVASLLPEQAPVEYGASLAEWEEATQGSVEEPAAAAVAAAAPAASTGDAPDTAAFGVPVTFGDVVYDEILWDGLLPPEYSPDALMARFSDQLADLQDGSPEAQLIYTEMQEELNNAPVNQALDGTMIRLPGFIAPLNYQDDVITEFLLVPYFGACIHVPPPPINQTVLVQTAEGQGIKIEESFDPIWVMGRLSVEESQTELAPAGYYVGEALIEPYDLNLPQ